MADSNGVNILLTEEGVNTKSYWGNSFIGNNPTVKDKTHSKLGHIRDHRLIAQ